MKWDIQGAPAFAFVHIDLEPGEKFYAESDSMTSMDSDIHLKARLFGGFFSALVRKFLGGESLFINDFTNLTNSTKRVTISQAFPGDIRTKELSDQEEFLMQPGAFIAATHGVEVSLKWAGFSSFLLREGLFRLKAKGKGTLFYGGFGTIQEKILEGEYIVDTGHLVAFSPGIEIKLGLPGGIISSFTSGEGLVAKCKGKGVIYLQTRSEGGLADWVNPKFPL
jgi:uncharacterized protein (TIGR00266 family)